jgi:hypothetical protein
MDFGKSFGFVFEDPDWVKKVAIGGVVTLVPIVNFATLGYSLEVTRRVITNDPKPLPEWDNFGDKFVKGFLVFVIGFVYSLPSTILGCISQGLNMAVLQGGSSRSEEGAIAAIAGLMLCLSCIQFIYSLFVGFFLPAAIGNFAAKGEIGAGFRLGDVFGLVQKNLGLYFMVLVLQIVAGIVGGLGLVLCLVGVVFTIFYAYTVMGHAYGQAYREASASIGLV